MAGGQHVIGSMVNPFVSGALAGLAVDVALFPIDTIKTRLQSPAGFWASGGFSRIYLGIGSTFSGSAPGAALFFLTYEASRGVLAGRTNETTRNMLAASIAETVACLVRVPVEVVKQRAQAYQLTSAVVLRQTIKDSGLAGLYRGYGITIAREIPFSLIQFPLWEAMRAMLREYLGLDHLRAHHSMACGSVAGGIAAFLTTPLDVAKTNIMLNNFVGDRGVDTDRNSSRPTYRTILSEIYRTKGVAGLFAGAVPRVIWISVGGAIFLGGYEQISLLISRWS